MNINFEIPVTYKGNEHSFPASLLTQGYSYKIDVDVYGKLISFEPDEESSFRAVVKTEDQLDDKIDRMLLREIALTIESIVK